MNGQAAAQNIRAGELIMAVDGRQFSSSSRSWQWVRAWGGGMSLHQRPRHAGPAAGAGWAGPWRLRPRQGSL